MPIITTKINLILENKNLTHYRLSKLMDFPEGALGMMLNAKSPFSPKAIKKLLPILEVSREEFESWIVADKYPKELLERAIEVRKAFPYKRKSILTTNIDKILKERGLSRTALAKQIVYSQSTLNAMIIGKQKMSKLALEKLSTAFEIPEEEILSWIVADRYKVEVLEMAYQLLDF